MISFVYLVALIQFLTVPNIVRGQLNGINRRDMMEEMEHLMVDNFGTNAVEFVRAVTPCLSYLGFASDPQDRGEQSSAEWVRVGFHDMVTANIAEGTGGIDASLGFESNRRENSGLFVNDTLQFFVPTVSAYMSMSDNIALGVVVSVATCGGSQSGIPVRVGRIDAEAAGPSGVPSPFTDIKTTLAQFAAAGFDQSDTIALTACGHTLGRVHHSDFPGIVDESFVTPTNIDGGDGFDTTPGVFDSNGVNDYLSGTGKMGGPLVTASNVAARSDFRLFNSDNNITLHSMTKEEAFQARCNLVFEKMINTVPKAVTLSDPVHPMPWKVVNLMLDISPYGIVSMSGLIRFLYDPKKTYPSSSISYSTTCSQGSPLFKSSSINGTGSSLYGNTTYYPFNNTLYPNTKSMNLHTISYPINDEIFLLPAQSRVSRARNVVRLRAAALTSLKGTMSGILYVPTSQVGTVSPKIAIVTVPMTTQGITAGDYTLYESGDVTVARAAGVVAKLVLGSAESSTVKSSLFVG